MCRLLGEALEGGGRRVVPGRAGTMGEGCGGGGLGWVGRALDARDRGREDATDRSSSIKGKRTNLLLTTYYLLLTTYYLPLFVNKRQEDQLTTYYLLLTTYYLLLTALRQ